MVANDFVDRDANRESNALFNRDSIDLLVVKLSQLGFHYGGTELIKKMERNEMMYSKLVLSIL